MSKKTLTLVLALVLALGIFAVPALAAFNASTWAQPELEKAQSYGLIPDVLKDVDYTKPITRAEFAAVSVKLYENLTGKTASPVAANPFKDTNDVEVLKAYNIGLTAGTAADTFSPNTLLNREQAATMLTRAIKASYINGWTLANDNAYTLNFTQPAKFADDAKISDWAKPSVYYANANNIIAGTGNNMFSPADSATREQAIAIAVRMVDNLKGKPIDYNGGTTQPPETTQPPTTTEPPTTTQPPETTQPPSGNSSLVGVWVPRPEYAIDYAGGIEFKADGTFFCIIKNNSGAVRGEITQKGKYTIQGDKIICTSVLESWKQQGGNQDRNYTDKAIADLTWRFYFSSTAENDIVEELYPGLSWLAINILPADPDDIDWFTRQVK